MYRTGYLYDHPIILYDCQKTRNTTHPREFLKDFSGVCVTDGYQVCHTLEKEKEDLTIGRKNWVMINIVNLRRERALLC